jgi:hypothetical protein
MFSCERDKAPLDVPPERVIQILSGHPSVRTAIREEQDAEYQRRRSLVDEITTIRAEAAVESARLSASVDDAAAALAPIMTEYQRLQREYVQAAAAVIAHSNDVDREIARREMELTRSADPAIETLAAQWENLFHDLRTAPRWETDPPEKLNILTGKRAAVPPIEVSYEHVTHCLDRIRQVQAEARAMKLQAHPDVSAKLDELRARLPKVSDLR